LTVGEDPISQLIAPPGDSSRADGIDELAQPRGRVAAGSKIEIAFVNNMPDSAFEETERQFTGLLDSAAQALGDTTICVSRHDLPGLERTPTIAKLIEDRYRPLDDIYSRHPDGLIITGTEPRADDPHGHAEPLAPVGARVTSRGGASATAATAGSHEER